MEVLQRTANRGSIATGGYEIDNSLKLEADNTEYLSQTIGAGSRTTATYSFWFKRTELGADMQLAGISPIGSETTRFLITSNDVLDVESGVGGDNNSLVTNRVFRDTSAWYHFVVAIDTTQATEANRVKVYVNGVQETSFSASEYPAQNTDLTIGVSGYTWRYGAYDNTYNKSSGYLAEAYYIDAQQLDPTSFGEFDEDTGIWKPIAYTGSFGSNGHYLDFSDAGDLGNNSSGVGNDFTLNNITSADQATDTPTNNFCTLNPIHVYSPAALPTISHGATKLTTTYQGWWTAAVSNIAFTSGKWYFEARSATSSTHLSAIGYGDEADIENWGIDRNANRQCHPGRTHSGVASKSFAYIGSDTEASYGRIFPNGTSPSTRVNYIYTDVIGVAIDADNGYAYWHKNGTYINSGDPTSGANGTGGYAVPSGTGTNGTLLPSVGAYYHSSIGVIEVNFGGYTKMSISSAASDANGYGTFEYAPPSGYYALCTKNLAEYG